MNKQATINQIAADGGRLIEACRADLTAPVLTCGDWTARDLVAHMGWVHSLVGTYLTKLATEPLGRAEMPVVPDDDTAADFAAGALGLVLKGLAGVEFDTPVWNWSPDPTAAFYFRRMVHETCVHRWDAESAQGEPGDIDGDLARDGIDEYFDFVIPNALKRKPRDLPEGTLHLHCTDGEGEWLIRGTPEGEVITERVHAKGDAAVRGSAAALYLSMWNRLSLNSDDVQVLGDPATAAAWAALAP